MGYMTLITFNLPLVFLERLPIIEKCLSTTCFDYQILYRHLVSVLRWGLLDSLNKIKTFQKFSGVIPGRSLSTGEASRKAIWIDMKIQRCELTNIRLTEQHGSG